MASQDNLVHTVASAPVVNARRVQVNDKFAQTADLRIAAQRSFMIDGRTVWADERGSGSKSKLYRCSGANFDAKASGELRKVTRGCPALIRACKQSATGEWKVTNLNYDHQNCDGGTKKPSIRALLPEATAIVKNSSTITAPALGKTLKATTGCGDIGGRTLNRLCRVIRHGGQESETYMRLADYLEQLNATSGGTITDCQFDKDGRFQRCFLMLGGAAYFATKGVQKVYSMDAAHLKGSWNGVILVLSFKNSNNNVIHVATAVCPKENADAYTYLLRNAMKFEPMKEALNNASYTCFSDGHEGSASALPALCPLTEDRWCLQHVLNNIPAVGKEGIAVAYEASKAPTESLFRASMDKLKANREAFWKGLNDTPHKLWANYADRGNMTWNQSTSNMSETVDSMIGAEIRAKPVMLMLQEIILKTADRMARAASASGDDSSVVPFAQKTYDTELQWSNGLEVALCGQGRFFVFSTGDQMRGNRVHLRLEEIASFPPSCTCGFFERFGIPCRHLITVGRYLEKSSEVFDLINPGYRLGHYRRAASDPRYPIVPPVWDGLDVNPTHHAPLRVDGQAGRPRKRKASNGEPHSSSGDNDIQLAQGSNSFSQGGPSQSGSSEAPIDVL